MTSEGKKCFLANVDFPALLAPMSATYESSGNFISMMFMLSAAVSPQSAVERETNSRKSGGLRTEKLQTKILNFW